MGCGMTKNKSRQKAILLSAKTKQIMFNNKAAKNLIQVSRESLLQKKEQILDALKIKFINDYNELVDDYLKNIHPNSVFLNKKLQNEFSISPNSCTMNVIPPAIGISKIFSPSFVEDNEPEVGSPLIYHLRPSSSSFCLLPILHNQKSEDQKTENALIRYEDGMYYGQIDNSLGFRDGDGIILLFNHEFYKGSWKDDMRWGDGQMHYENGTLYSGEWSNGRRNGKGLFFKGKKRPPYDTVLQNMDVYTTLIQSIYYGDWENDKIEGNGMQWIFWESMDDEFYEGEFKDGHKSGEGLRYSYDKKIFKYDIYLGSFTNNFPNGHGVIFFSNGWVYEGNMVDGFRHGEGIFYNNNGYLLQDGIQLPISQQNQENSKNISQDYKMEKYSGSWEKGQKSGFGIQYFNNGNKYEGQFLKNKFHGKGSYTYADGQVYEGPFYKSKPHGIGRLIIPGESSINHQYKYGNLIREWI